MKCDNCKQEEQLYELVGSKCCSNCWEEYWRDNDIGMDTSFEDFLDHTCTKVKEEEKEK